jgi:hypothetical protein
MAGNPRTNNPYAYAFNNPLKYRDPTGACVPDVNCPGDIDAAEYVPPSLSGPSKPASPQPGFVAGPPAASNPTPAVGTPTPRPTANPGDLKRIPQEYVPYAENYKKAQRLPSPGQWDINYDPETGELYLVPRKKTPGFAPIPTEEYLDDLPGTTEFAEDYGYGFGVPGGGGQWLSQPETLYSVAVWGTGAAILARLVRLLAY